MQNHQKASQIANNSAIFKPSSLENMAITKSLEFLRATPPMPAGHAAQGGAIHIEHNCRWWGRSIHSNFFVADLELTDALKGFLRKSFIV